jgi:hypothetical protein
MIAQVVPQRSSFSPGLEHPAEQAGAACLRKKGGPDLNKASERRDLVSAPRVNPAVIRADRQRPDRLLPDFPDLNLDPWDRTEGR